MHPQNRWVSTWGCSPTNKWVSFHHSCRTVSQLLEVQIPYPFSNPIPLQPSPYGCVPFFPTTLRLSEQRGPLCQSESSLQTHLGVSGGWVGWVGSPGESPKSWRIARSPWLHLWKVVHDDWMSDGWNHLYKGAWARSDSDRAMELDHSFGDKFDRAQIKVEYTTWMFLARFEDSWLVAFDPQEYAMNDHSWMAYISRHVSQKTSKPTYMLWQKLIVNREWTVWKVYCVCLANLV